MNRRQFLATSTSAVIAAAFKDVPLFGRQGQLTTSFEDLRRGVGIFNGQGGTIGWLVNGDGILVIDSQNAAAAQACIDGIGQRSTRPIDVLVNTHHHGDHTGGNQVFRPVVGAIVAHENSASWQRQAAPDQGAGAYPDTTFTDEWRTTIGDETVVAKYYGAGHTSGDVTVTFERANVVHMGDLMFNRLHPFIDRPSGARILSWIETLEQVPGEHAADTIYIFGHGSPNASVTGNRSELAHLRDYFSAALELTRREMQAGKSKEEITSTESLAGFEDHVSPFALLSLNGVLGVAYDELSAR
jgi:glyoxylase-like metal-dependent hydrolase (beta-lactamase superfamily II)